ncbi:DNA adenine methylase [Sinimarinibacterium sp. NLF-5-8]|uniref:DNA adenine methylase n=1 Tax=Sinimarinibacterium sp. NLF-5-8 TaxID=2698684 RepID=UPI00137C2878|nr:DNA adenine methylase [Sinimarinibacterium sp. NLF-5-8]QHS09152.1 DNA adenine methylase [Sinimarinibacterium sp. NLF-5-8]
MSTQVKHPPLRYHGSKWQIADWIIERLAPHFTYVEPFGGGASVLLRKPVSAAEVYNDLDGEITNFFRVLRNDRDELLRKLFLTPYSRDEYDACFALARSGTVTDTLEKARLTAVISYQALTSAGVTRASKPGWRCWAKPGWGQTPMDYWKLLEDRLLPVAERLRAVVIENRPALDVISAYDNDQALHYIDPPYLASTRSEGLGSYRHEMSDEDHISLARTLHNVKGMVMVSGYDSDLYQELYKGWNKQATQSAVEGRNQRVECIWLNPRLSRLSTQPRLF